MSDTNRFTLEVGRFRCGAMRDHLEQFRNLGYSIQWSEGRGLFSREFSVWGNDDHIRYIYGWLQRNFINGD